MTVDTFWDGYPTDWDRLPALVDPAMSRLSDAFHHAPTGAVATSTIIRGQWTRDAVEELRGCLASTLPAHHTCRILRLGIIRVLIFLGTTPSSHHAVPRLLATRPPVKEDLTAGDAVLRCSTWSFDQAVAVLTGSMAFAAAPRPPASPSGEVLAAFREAEAAFGHDIDPPGAHWAHVSGEGDWTELRESSGHDIRDHLYQWSRSSVD